MNWGEAVFAMSLGRQVNRVSEMAVPTRIAVQGAEVGPPIFECGEEPMRLAMAIAANGDFVQVFQGACSRMLFEPTDEHKAAMDWVCVP